MDPSALDYVLLLAGIPLLVVLVVVLAVMGPGWTRAGAYRPGEPWNHEPVIISASETGDVTAALGTSAVGELGVANELDPAREVASGSEGGASAKW